MKKIRNMEKMACTNRSTIKIFMWLIVLIGIFMSVLCVNVSAWSNSTFNNSLGREYLLFTSPSEFVRYLTVPQNVYITNGFFNITYPVGIAKEACYSFEETSGVLIDLASGKHNGTVGGVVTRNQTGKVGKAYNFSIGANVTMYGTFTEAVTSINIWVYYNHSLQGSSARILQTTSNDPSLRAIEDVGLKKFFPHVNTGAVSYDFNVSGGAGNNLTQNQWHMLTIVFNGTQLDLYVNATKTVTHRIEYNNWTEEWGISNNNPGANGGFNGSVDELSIWTRKLLTQAEINALYNDGNGKDCDANKIILNIGTDNYLNLDVSNSTPETNATIRTPNLRNYINDYTSTCTFAAGVCQVPFSFNSTLEGIFLLYSNLTFNNVGFTENSQSYSNNTFDTSIETFSINITYDKNRYLSALASFVYNGTSYTATETGGGGNKVFTKVIPIPITASNTNKTFFWAFSMTDTDGTVQFNSTAQNQTIHPSNFSTCGVGAKAVNYTIYDEKTLAKINVTFDGTFTWNLDQSSTETKTFSTTLGSIHGGVFCINANRTFFTDAELSLSNAGYSTRGYFLDNEEYSNTTTHKNLYLLNSTNAKDVIVVVKDSGLTPLEDYTVKIYRKYESSGEYVLIESDKTDGFGQVVTSLEENEVKYKFQFYNSEGTLVKTVNNVVVACRSSICIQQFIISDTTDPFDFNVGETDYSYTFVFANDTNIFTFAWVDNRDTSSIHRLEVIRRSMLNGSTIVCNTSSTFDSGVLTCSVGADRYSYSASAYRKVDGKELRVDLLTVKVGDKSATFGLEGLFWSLILLVTMAIIGIYYPPVGVVLYLVGIFALGTFDIVYIPLGVMIAELVIGVAFIWSFRG